MSGLILPPAGDGPKHDSNDGKNGDKTDRRRRKPKIPSAEKCLEAINRLPGLIALRVLTPIQANSIRASYQTILRHHESTQRRSAGAGLKDADVQSLMQMDKAVLDMLEPLLTDEQIDQIMRHTEEEQDEGEEEENDGQD